MANDKLSNEEKRRLSTFFKNWYVNQTKYTLTDIAKELKIPHSTLFDYLKKGQISSKDKANLIIKFIKSHPIDNENEELYNKPLQEDVFTKIEKNTIFYQIDELNILIDSLQKNLKNFQIQGSSHQLAKSKSSEDELSNHINNFKLALYALNFELNWFKNKTTEERKALRKGINANDIGYITSSLRAMIKGEEVFNDWILTSNYQLGMLKWQKPR
jgi:archaellum component FlaC